MLKLDRYSVLSEVCSGAWMGAGWSRCQSNPSHPNNQTSHATLGGVRGEGMGMRGNLLENTREE